MLNLTELEFKHRLSVLNETHDLIEEDLKKVENKRLSIIDEEKRLNEEILNVDKKIEAVKRGILLTKELPTLIIKQRDKIVRKTERIKSQNTTVKKRNLLYEEIQKQINDLQKICDHPFIFHKQGYAGSAWTENGYPSERYCAICGFEEKAKSSGPNDFVGTIFNKLKDDDTRIIQHEPFRAHPECLGKIHIWQPLGAVLHPFEKYVEEVLNNNTP